MQLINDFILDPFTLNDAPRLALVINDKQIYQNTLSIPFPYQLSDAEMWITKVVQQQKNGEQLNWAIRNSEGLVCGSIGLMNKYGTGSDRDEIGYWLMRSLWGKGIMTSAIEALTDYSFRDRGLKRLEAVIFIHNRASARVLEKNGYKLEGTIKNSYLKDGKYIDGLLYAKVCD